ncbi:hypothetical protein DAPPUDRAFT_246534 [Daphnia pulex]|uniref:Uncharacterized protein n=1 Tax=Daphnia pulex TaxID=6669 RepID=E9GQS4_DAPPU|nr:hypothetical protein DAPPUDRAFT_246534 [Daphnia pulex]|eukprot:EFX78167.1 hypothetical protein DAPPUDRAFT_246534 [Daphnia pulex]
MDAGRSRHDSHTSQLSKSNLVFLAFLSNNEERIDLEVAACGITTCNGKVKLSLWHCVILVV